MVWNVENPENPPLADDATNSCLTSVLFNYMLSLKKKGKEAEKLIS